MTDTIPCIFHSCSALLPHLPILFASLTAIIITSWAVIVLSPAAPPYYIMTMPRVTVPHLSGNHHPCSCHSQAPGTVTGGNVPHVTASFTSFLEQDLRGIVGQKECAGACGWFWKGIRSLRAWGKNKSVRITDGTFYQTTETEACVLLRKGSINRHAHYSRSSSLQCCSWRSLSPQQ